MSERKIKRVTVQLKPEHVELIRTALDQLDAGRETLRVLAKKRQQETMKLREEVLRALNGRASI